MRNASTASERILKSGRSHEYLYQRSDSEHESHHELDIPVFMKEDLVPIIGDQNMIQEMPEEFNKVLEVQRSWQK